MQKYLTIALNIYIYSSVHIAICVSAMILQTFYIIGEPLKINTFILFCFLSTILTYTLHKIVGAYRARTPNIGIRIKLFKHNRLTFIIYALMILPVFIHVFLQLEISLIKLFILPGLISMFYVFPITKSGNRLRDFAYIKLFLIGIVWMMVTVIIPMLMHESTKLFILLMSAEKLLFIMALTLPFDIRDLFIDKSSGVKTIAGKLGVQKTFALSAVLILASIICISIAYSLQFIDMDYLIIMIIAYGASLGTIFYTLKKTHDFYYAGLLDGLMMLPFLFILIYQFIIQ